LARLSLPAHPWWVPPLLSQISLMNNSVLRKMRKLHERLMIDNKQMAVYNRQPL
jgi:hypothetical protein